MELTVAAPYDVHGNPPACVLHCRARPRSDMEIVTPASREVPDEVHAGRRVDFAEDLREPWTRDQMLEFLESR